MNAVADESIERRSRGRPRRTYEENVVAYELKHWGFFKGRQYAADGWSPSSTLAQLMSGRSDNPGHKILVLDMPPEAWNTNAVVMRLPTDYIGVLIARYCLPVEPATGRPYEPAFLAGLLAIELNRYRARLVAAQLAYKHLIFPRLGIDSFS